MTNLLQTDFELLIQELSLNVTTEMKEKRF